MHHKRNVNNMIMLASLCTRGFLSKAIYYLMTETFTAGLEINVDSFC